MGTHPNSGVRPFPRSLPGGHLRDRVTPAPVIGGVFEPDAGHHLRVHDIAECKRMFQIGDRVLLTAN